MHVRDMNKKGCVVAESSNVYLSAVEKGLSLFYTLQGVLFFGFVFFPSCFLFKIAHYLVPHSVKKQPSRWCAAKFVDDRLESGLFMRRSGDSSTPPARL